MDMELYDYDKKNVMTFCQIDGVESGEELQELDDYSHQVICFDNINDPNPDLLKANIMSGITTPFRFPGHAISTMKSLNMTLQPLQFAKYLTPGFAATQAKDASFDALFSPDCLLKDHCQPFKLMGAVAIYRGPQ